MVVSGGRMKERNRFLPPEGFNDQLKRRIRSSCELTDFLTLLGGTRRRLKLPRFSRSSRGSDSFYRGPKSGGKALDSGTRPGSDGTAEPTTYQKVRRIIAEHSERQSRSSSRPKVGPSSSSGASKSRELTNYSIVASTRCENARNGRNGYTGFSSFSVCETTAASCQSRAALKTNGGTATGRRKSSRVRNHQDIVNLPKKNSNLPFVPEPSRRTRQDSVKVTLVRAKESRDLPWGPVSVEDRNGCPIGYQRRLLDKFPPGYFQSNDIREPAGRPSSSRGKTAQVLRENGTSTVLPESYKNRVELRRSPSTSLPSSWKKPTRVGVKKSVSFSSDTSFQEKKSLFTSKTHAHEAKVYHKGVLQDRASPIFESLRDAVATSPSPTATTTTTTTTSTTTATTTNLGGPLALVRAARDGSNSALRQMMANARTPQGGREININALDASGRTALSYMAGDGAAAMLEAALSFPEVDVNLPDNEGNTPLHFATQAGQLECVSILLQRCPGIEVDARNTLGFTPLMKAAIQGRTKCAKILLFAGANPTLRDYGRGLRAEQWARFCGRYVCAEVIERFARHRLLERTTSCRWGSEPELAARVLQGKVTPVPTNLPPQPSTLKSKIRRVFRTSSGPDNRSFSLVSQLTSAALCASSPALPRPGEVPPVVKSLIRPLSVPQLRITLVPSSDGAPPVGCRAGEKIHTNFTEKIVSEKIESSVSKPPRSKKKSK
ncbi:SH3 and multiple ankyrin repeat domains protein 1-like isoform X1 [Neodiprion fabricii]|uniref:SH3 and multiple ankyrin repeat domains protein 1-like isoform X1 n=1 Tax=Neodiprion fabricii TaxID=2872261 RepID=UPI001ED96FEF|nr:SH3 and multiple ankyrin repeat domains protein 1-like isoform X1 [Neodiprion fabricii]